MNNYLAIGKIISPITLAKDKKSAKTVLAITNSFDKKITNIPITLPEKVGLNAYKYLQINSLVGIKGLLVSNEETKKLQVIVNSLTFLSSKKKEA